MLVAPSVCVARRHELLVCDCAHMVAQAYEHLRRRTSREWESQWWECINLVDSILVVHAEGRRGALPD